MPRQRQGTFERDAVGNLRVRVTVTVRTTTGIRTERPWIKLDPKMSDDEARAVAKGLALELKDRVLDEHQLAALKGQQRKPARKVRDFIEHVYLPKRRHLAQARYESGWWDLHILPILGDHDVRTFGPEPLRQVVAYLDGRVRDESVRFSWKTAQNIWTLVTGFCDALCTSKDPEVRIRDDNPSEKVTGPDTGAETAKQWLYPTELHRLLDDEEIPLEFARYIATCVYLFARPGEGLALDWEHSIDLRHRMATIDCSLGQQDGTYKDHTKSHDVRVFPVPDVLVPMLEAMRREQGAKGRLFTRSSKRAVNLRAALWTAGVRRPELHKPGRNSAPMRVHDLRATGISYLAMAGHSDEDIRERAGHSDFATTLLYIRRGKRVSDAIGDPFAPLPARLVSSRESSRVVSVPLVKPVGAAGIEPAHPKRQAEIIEESATVRALNTPDGAGCEGSGDDSLDDSFFAAFVEHQARAEAYQALSRPAKRRVKVAEIRRRRKGAANG